jgi:hypothetical protein
MKATPTTNSPGFNLNIFKRFDIIVPIVVIAGGLVACIMILTGILNQFFIDISAPTGQSSAERSTQEKITIKVLDGPITNQTLPSGRINPFIE